MIAITGSAVKPRRKIWWRQRWQQPVRYTRPVAIRIMSWVFRSRFLIDEQPSVRRDRDGGGATRRHCYLCQLARPNVAVCLNASAAHLAHYDSVDAIAATKGEIFEGLAGKGLAVINADQKWLPQWREQAGTARQVTFGLAGDADYRAIDIEHRGIEGSYFQLLTPTGSVAVSLQLAGEQHVKNALAALAIAIEVGVAPSDAAVPFALARALVAAPSVNCPAAAQSLMTAKRQPGGGQRGAGGVGQTTRLPGVGFGPNA
ncbi:MAG: hypothetical protein CM15mP89_1140 [Gammaproteobacteria bacterium]|nr:MAG: hypothetical protein CM15mP89_1140 [Gammaproteobacteria bacterium]